MLVEIASSGIRSPKVIKKIIAGCFGSSRLSLDLIFMIRVSKISSKSSESLLLFPSQLTIYYLKRSLKRLSNRFLVRLLKRFLYFSLVLLRFSSICFYERQSSF
jgi:hypothetical protein